MSYDPSQPAIKARGLQKIYPAQGKNPEMEALKTIDLTIPKGSIFGLLGPNGAGKSTFINILAGTVKKTQGSVSVCGIDLDSHPRDMRGALGIVGQEINMDPFFTPLESMEMMAGFYGVPKSERRSMEILEALGLGDKSDAYVRQLSGGMKRRLMVAKALVHRPPVIILDEPTAGVDVELRRQLWEYVRELHAEGATIVLTTHYLEEAQELCDEIAIINHGEVIACEPTPKLLKRLNQKTLVIRSETLLEEIPSQLSLPEGVMSGLKQGALSLTYDVSAFGIEELLKSVRDSGLAIIDLATEEPDLEDVFVTLTTAQEAA